MNNILYLVVSIIIMINLRRYVIKCNYIVIVLQILIFSFFTNITLDNCISDCIT